MFTETGSIVMETNKKVGRRKRRAGQGIVVAQRLIERGMPNSPAGPMEGFVRAIDAASGLAERVDGGEIYETEAVTALDVARRVADAQSRYLGSALAQFRQELEDRRLQGVVIRRLGRPPADLERGAKPDTVRSAELRAKREALGERRVSLWLSAENRQRLAELSSSLPADRDAVANAAIELLWRALTEKRS